MKITLTEVDRIAALSKLRLSEEEKQLFLPQFQKILDHVNAIRDVDTEGIAPCSNVFELVNVLREDEVVPSFDTELLLRTAPDVEDGSYLVPKVVE